MTAENRRHLLSVTMRPELYQAAKAAAARRDLPVTAWVREVVVAELQRLASTTT
jgi:hypothetical protein